MMPGGLPVSSTTLAPTKRLQVGGISNIADIAVNRSFDAESDVLEEPVVSLPNFRIHHKDAEPIF